MARQSKEHELFTALMDRLLTVPKAELDRREAEYKKEAAKNPKKRGPKPKVIRSLTNPNTKPLVTRKRN